MTRANEKKWNERSNEWMSGRDLQESLQERKKEINWMNGRKKGKRLSSLINNHSVSRSTFDPGFLCDRWQGEDVGVRRRRRHTGASHLHRLYDLPSLVSDRCCVPVLSSPPSSLSSSSSFAMEALFEFLSFEFYHFFHHPHPFSPVSVYLSIYLSIFLSFFLSFFLPFVALSVHLCRAAVTAATCSVPWTPPCIPTARWCGWARMHTSWLTRALSANTRTRQRPNPSTTQPLPLRGGRVLACPALQPPPPSNCNSQSQPPFQCHMSCSANHFESAVAGEGRTNEGSHGPDGPGFGCKA